MKDISRKELTEVRKNLTISLIEREAEAANGLFKWLTATGLTFNGGALLSLLNIEERYPGVLISSGIFFAVGLLTTIFAGTFGIFAHGSVANAVAKELWSGRIREDIEEFSEEKTGMALVSFLYFILILISVGLFFYGCYGFSETITSSK